MPAKMLDHSPDNPKADVQGYGHVARAKSRSRSRLKRG